MNLSASRFRSCAVALVALAAASCAAPSQDARPSGAQSTEGPGAAESWQRLPDPPLSPRTHAVVVSLGDRVIVVGGWTFLCPPSADCQAPNEPLLDDGAVYDSASGSWKGIATPPFGLRRQDYATATVDDTAYVLTGCADGPACDARPRLLSYAVPGNRWVDHGPVPGPKASRHLVAVDQQLLLYSATDEHGEFADVLFDPRRSSWTEIPDDPLSRTFDRFMVPVGDQVVLVGASIDALDAGEDGSTLAARWDLGTRTWTVLEDAPEQGYQLLPTDRGPLLAGHFTEAPGWILDPDTWTWSVLPDRAGDSAALSGVLDRDRAIYDLPSGVGPLAAAGRFLVYDSVADAFVTVPAPPGREDVYEDSGTAVGRDLFVYGGQRWNEGPGELVGDAWLWSAPVG